MSNKASLFPSSWRSVLSCRFQIAPVLSSSILCPGLGVLSDRDQAGGSKGTGPGLAPTGTTFHGDPTQ